MTARFIRVWARVEHGKKQRSKMVVAGIIPKGEDIPRKLHFEVKKLVRAEWQRTGHVVSAEGVEGIIAATRLANALL